MIPKECYEQYGKDLDGCSTQAEEGCGRCVLNKNEIDINKELFKTNSTTEINIDYYEELKAKADKWDEKETPKEVIDEDGITFSCPTCYADNSKWIDWSMLQRRPKRAKVCQECGQKLDWPE